MSYITVLSGIWFVKIYWVFEIKKLGKQRVYKYSILKTY